MQLFLRYAEISGWLPNPFFTKARDCRILYILAGRGELRFPEQTVPLETGCFCYYPAGQAYWPCSSKEEPLHPRKTDEQLPDGSSRRSLPGSISFVPSVAGLVLAGEVIKDLISQ